MCYIYTEKLLHITLIRLHQQLKHTARAARAGGPPARAILHTYFARSTRDRLSVTADRTAAPAACGSDRPHTHQLHPRWLARSTRSMEMKSNLPRAHELARCEKPTFAGADRSGRRAGAHL